MKDNFDSLEEISEINELEEIYDYFNSEENLKNCGPFEQLNQKYVSLQKRYASSFHELYKDIESKVYRREYSKGGNFHRGFYSPSAKDLVIGNCNRGKLLKRPPKDSNYDYEYLFDNQNNLICVYKYSNYKDVPKLATTELFTYEQGVLLSLIFNSDNSHSLSFVSECQYKNGLLTRYENALCELFYGGKGCTEINVETYEYKNDLLSSFCWCIYMPSIHSLTQEQYTFNRDMEGYLSTFTVKQLGGFKPKTNFDLDSVIYKVNVKRK